SFVNTMNMAGKRSTINLTYCGAGASHYDASGHEWHNNHVDLLVKVVKHFVDQGFTGLQVTLENEPNGAEGTTKSDHDPKTNKHGMRYRLDEGFREIKEGKQLEHSKDPAKRARGAAEVKAGTKERNESAAEYVHEYAALDAALAGANVRDHVKIVGGDMVGGHRTAFFTLITKLGLNKYVDAYSFHIYWGANKGLKSTLQQLVAIKKLAKKVAPDKALQITEYGKEHFASAQEKRANGGLGTEADEKGGANAFDQALFALSAINDGFVGALKWDAF